MGQSLEDIFRRPAAAAPSAPPPKSDLTTIVVIGLLLFLGYTAWQKYDFGHDEKREDDKGQVDPAPQPTPNPKPVKLEGSRLVFVYEMQTASADQISVTGNLAELQQRLQMKERVLFDSEMTDPVVKQLIADVDSQFKLKPPFMALTKNGKPFKAATFPLDVKFDQVEAFVK